MHHRLSTPPSHTTPHAAPSHSHPAVKPFPPPAASVMHRPSPSRPSASTGTSAPATVPSTPSQQQQQPQQQDGPHPLQEDQASPASLPTTYRRLVAKGCGRSFGDVATIAELPMPTPGAGEVLVRMRYAGINGGCETFRARGEYWFAGNRGAEGGFALGAEGCGEVVAVGPGVQNVRVGQAVTANGGNAFTEYAIAKAAMCTPLSGPPSAEAVAVSLSGLTAVAALEGVAKLQPGESVAVTAAAGGTGHLAVQVALAKGASVVIAVAGGPEKVAALEALDPRVRGVDRKLPDFEARLAAAVPPGGVDVVYEGVGGAMQRTMLHHLAPAGRLLQVGYISEYPHVQGYPDQGEEGAGAQGEAQGPGEAREGELPPCSKLFWNGLTVTRGEQRIYGSVWPKDPKEMVRCKRRVFQLWEEGALKVWIDQSAKFKGLEEITDAVEHMLRGGHMGKVVVEL